MQIKIDLEAVKKCKLFVATPMFGAMCHGLFCKSTNDLAILATKYGLDVRFYYLMGESLIQRGRNYCVSEFLRSDCTHMIFIDADIAFNPKDIFTMLSLQISDPQKYDIVTGPYPKKVIAWEKVQDAVNSGFGKEDPRELANFTGDFVFNVPPNTTEFRLDQPVEILDGGTGFMLIPRATFDKYREAYPHLMYRPDHVRTEHFDGSQEIMAYFDCGIDPESKRYLSEDYFFTQNARKAGMKVWMCPWINLRHIGSYTYSGTLQHIAAIGSTHNYTKPNSKSEKQPLTRQQRRAIERKKETKL